MNWMSIKDQKYFPLGIYNNTEFGKQLRSFRFYNSKISEWIDKSGQNDQSTIINYPAMIKKKFGPADLKVRPFITNTYEGNDELRFLKTIGQTVNKAPIGIFLCSKILFSKGPWSSQDSCGSHEVVLVGAYYENGKCKARIRNSWGKDWGDQGHNTVPLDDLLLAQKAVLKTEKSTFAFYATWLEKPLTDDTKSQVSFTDSEHFIGKLKYNFDPDDTYRDEPQKGVYYIKGKPPTADRLPILGGEFTGTVQEKNGEYLPIDGILTDSAGNTKTITNGKSLGNF